MYTNHPSPLSSEGAEKQQNGIGDHEQASAASSGPVHTPTGHTPTHADPSPGAHPQTHSQQRTGVLLEEHRREVISPCPGHHRDSQGPCFLGVSPLCQPPPTCPSHWCNNFSAILQAEESGNCVGGYGQLAGGRESSQASGGPERVLEADCHQEPSPTAEQVGPSQVPAPTGSPAPALSTWGTGLCLCPARGSWALMAPTGRPEGLLRHQPAALPTPAVRKWDSWPETNKKKVFSFCINGNKIQEKLPPLTSECDALPWLRFLCHRFVFGPQGQPSAGSPGSDPGGVCITPFYLYKKNDGLKNVLRKKNVLFYK